MTSKRKEIFFMYLSAFTIGLPWTVVGFIALLIVTTFYNDRYKIIFVNGRIGITILESRFGGVSLGIVYIVDGSNSVKLHCHELGHTIQFKWLGLLFLPIIGIPSIIRYHFRRLIFIQKHFKLRSYDAVWYEGQATKLGMNRFYEEVMLKINTSH